MRIGSNPNNHKKIEEQTQVSHRVIIPVYIPNLEGYFADAFEVFKVCVQSLLKTINSDTKVTVISNGSTAVVNDYIYNLWEEKKIDKAVFNKENEGKMNAIISETRASFEAFITYSDADVFFDKNWLLNTYEAFRDVPKLGYVSMSPALNNYAQCNYTLLENLFLVLKKKRSIKQVCQPIDVEHFQYSIGKTKEQIEALKNKPIFTIGKAQKYLIGAGHFCCTIRKHPTLSFVPKNKCNYSVSGGSEAVYLDIPFDKTGLWKLSTTKAYVWHMGNVLEKKWAVSKLQSIESFEEKEFSFSELNQLKQTFVAKVISYYFIARIRSILKRFKIM